MALLGIECGGTHTTVALSTSPGATEPAVTFQLGPANFRLTSADEYATLLAEAFARLADPPAAIGLAVAGARHASQHAELEAMVRSALAQMGDGAGWGATIPVRASHDLESACLASGPLAAAGAARLVCIAGTGSCCYGRTSAGAEVRGGGWGHLLGDEGSGFMLGSGLLRLLTIHADRQRRSSAGSGPTPLMAKVLAAVGLGDSSGGWDDMIDWVASAGKDQVAALAEICLAAAADPGADADCAALVVSEAEKLSATAAETLAALCSTTSGPDTLTQEVLLYGGLFEDTTFRAAFTAALARRAPAANPTLPPRPSVCGALEMAAVALAGTKSSTTPAPPPPPTESPAACWVPPLASLGLRSPTELRNPLSTSLSTMPTEQAVGLFLEQDTLLPGKIATAHTATLTALVGAISAAFKAGGRLIYAGAGSSGRLGVLDAAECPPTFGSDPAMVQGLIAGGPRALLKAVEGAEDSTEGGRADILGHGACPLLGGPVQAQDVVIGIAASGRTPYVWGVIAEAKRAGATTGLLCFNPNVLEALALPETPPGCAPDHVMAINAGPELLTGSTRLKAGTATKLVLNILTTLSLGVGMGKVPLKLHKS